MSKKIGLALGGGAVLGGAHIGVLKAIEELDINIEYVAGTSIGALIGTLFASGKSSSEIEEIALELNWLDISTITLSKLGLLSNEKIGDFLLKHLGDVEFKDLKIPFATVATDISTGSKIILKKGKVVDAVVASTSIPALFVPIKINNKTLVDGALVENVPISALDELGAKFKIGVDLNNKKLHKNPSNIIEVILNSFDIMLNYPTKKALQNADITIKPNLKKFNAINTKQLKELINQGYIDSKKILLDFV